MARRSLPLCAAQVAWAGLRMFGSIRHGPRRGRGDGLPRSLADGRGSGWRSGRGVASRRCAGPCPTGWLKYARMACKPDFVQGLPPWMTIPLAPPLPTGSSCQPGPAGAKMALSCDARSLFGIAPGGACRAGPVARPAVGSYPTVSPLPIRGWAVSSLWRFPWGCPRRALPGTLASWSPDFPRTSRPAAVRPSARG